MILLAQCSPILFQQFILIPMYAPCFFLRNWQASSCPCITCVFDWHNTCTISLNWAIIRNCFNQQFHGPLGWSEAKRLLGSKCSMHVQLEQILINDFYKTSTHISTVHLVWGISSTSELLSDLDITYSKQMATAQRETKSKFNSGTFLWH